MHSVLHFVVFTGVLTLESFPYEYLMSIFTLFTAISMVSNTLLLKTTLQQLPLYIRHFMCLRLYV